MQAAKNKGVKRNLSRMKNAKNMSQKYLEDEGEPTVEIGTRKVVKLLLTSSLSSRAQWIRLLCTEESSVALSGVYHAQYIYVLVCVLV